MKKIFILFFFLLRICQAQETTYTPTLQFIKKIIVRYSDINTTTDKVISMNIETLDSSKTLHDYRLNVDSIFTNADSTLASLLSISYTTLLVSDTISQGGDLTGNGHEIEWAEPVEPSPPIIYSKNYVVINLNIRVSGGTFSDLTEGKAIVYLWIDTLP